MGQPADTILQHIGEQLASAGAGLWGLADLSTFPTPADDRGKRFPRAIAFAVPMNPSIMAGIAGGPTQAYADEYLRVNDLINRLSESVEQRLIKSGVRARRLAASERSDPIAIQGDFPHKTAATRAGLGWIGRNCQLITRRHGPWIRLGTVFTDLDAGCGRPVGKHGCGRCRRCVDACPAGALTGSGWVPGIEREKILDAPACDRWKKTHYRQFNHGHNCGICAAVCPFGK